MKRSAMFILLIMIISFTNNYSQVTITLPTASGAPNEEILASVNVSDLTGKKVYAFQFQVNYNKNFIYITDYSISGAIISPTNPQVRADTAAGFFRLVWASADSLVGAGTLVKLKIKLRTDGLSPLTFDTQTFPTKFQTIVNGQSSDYTVTEIAGSINVTSVNNPPVFDAVPPKTVNEGESLSFTVNATDGEGDPITYSAQNLPEGASFTPATKTFSWTPTFAQASSYAVDFIANDGNSSSSITVLITVNNVNQAPVFVEKLADQIVTVHNVPVQFSFQYTATDPDGDALTFASIQVPAGAGINSSGLFTWTPTVDQANQLYTIIVAVFDNTTFTRDTATVATSPVVGVEDNNIPTNYSLQQNFPNPFNPTTNIRFTLPNESFVKLRVFNMLGEEREIVKFKSAVPLFPSIMLTSFIDKVGKSSSLIIVP